MQHPTILIGCSAQEQIKLWALEKLKPWMPKLPQDFSGGNIFHCSYVAWEERYRCHLSLSALTLYFCELLMCHQTVQWNMSFSINTMVAVTVSRKCATVWSTEGIKLASLWAVSSLQSKCPQNCNWRSGSERELRFRTACPLGWHSLETYLIHNWIVRKATKALVFITSGILLLKVPVGHTQLGL